MRCAERFNRFYRKIRWIPFKPVSGFVCQCVCVLGFVRGFESVCACMRVYVCVCVCVGGGGIRMIYSFRP